MDLGELKRSVVRMKNHFKVFEGAEKLLEKLIGAEQVVGELKRKEEKLNLSIVDLKGRESGLASSLGLAEEAYIKERDRLAEDLILRQHNHKDKLKALDVKYENRHRELEASYVARADRDRTVEEEKQKHRELLESDIKMLEGKFNQLKNAVKNL
jgi:hypothetical protein